MKEKEYSCKIRMKMIRNKRKCRFDNNKNNNINKRSNKFIIRNRKWRAMSIRILRVQCRDNRSRKRKYENYKKSIKVSRI
jgi:hypothetical protein